MPHNMPRNHHTPGRGSAERGGAGKNRDGGTSRTPSPTGRLRVGRGCVNGYAQASVTQKPVGVGVPDDPLFRRPRGKKTVQRKITFVGAASHPRPYVRRPPTYRRRVFFRTTYSNQKCRPTGGIFTILRHGDANCNKKRPSRAFSQLPRRGAPKLHSVRRADTLAAEWVLRASERRAGLPALRGRRSPKSAFLWGSTPFLWARPKKWGGVSSVEVLRPLSRLCCPCRSGRCRRWTSFPSGPGATR